MEERQFASLLKECGDTNLNLCLSAAAAAMAAAEFEDAERLYRRGLKWSEGRFGLQSAAVGLVLMSLIKLYETDGKNRDTRSLEDRCRQIFRRYFFRALSASLSD